MTGNELGGGPSGPMFVHEIPAEYRQRQKKSRLIVTGGPLGPQLMVLPDLDGDGEEEDPNP